MRKPTRRSRTAKATARSTKRAAVKRKPRVIAKKAGAKWSKPASGRRPDPLDRFIDAAAQALRLPVEDAWRPAIAANLRVTLEHAASVEAFALPEDAEPGPLFKA